MAEEGLYIGVDVGTGSVRAGLFNIRGDLIAHHKHDIQTWRDANGHIEQSSDNIWTSVVSTIKAICKGVDVALIKGIGFDATCSLVAVNPTGQPVSVSQTGDPQRNIILWQDHRAVQEAKEINSTSHPVLKFVGGTISPEMQPPKLLWLKRHLNEQCWKKAGHFFDLADFLTYRATGKLSRSLCCLVCKFTYIGHHPSEPNLCHGWNDSFFNEIGLSDLVTERYSRIGVEVIAPGVPVEGGLCSTAARELGLPETLPVATGIIDAHAGGLGMIGASFDGPDCHMTSRCALIGGTSSVHMALSASPIFVSGIWGPYYSVMVPGLYLSEGGQTSTGQLIDNIIQAYHPAVIEELTKAATQMDNSMYEQLEATLNNMAREPTFVTRDLHVSPDFLGNRSPLADPSLVGMISGLTLGHSVGELAKLYLASIQALAYGTRHILEAMEQKGHKFKILMICGGLRQNRLYLQAHADITGLPVVLTEQKEVVLLGSSMLAATATGLKLEEVMSKMCRASYKDSILPNSSKEITEFHQKKFTVFQELYKDQLKYRTMMAQ